MMMEYHKMLLTGLAERDSLSIRLSPRLGKNLHMGFLKQEMT